VDVCGDAAVATVTGALSNTMPDAGGGAAGRTNEGEVEGFEVVDGVGI
jgi:hypothetical protein